MFEEKKVNLFSKSLIGATIQDNSIREKKAVTISIYNLNIYLLFNTIYIIFLSSFKMLFFITSNNFNIFSSILIL